MQYICPFLVQTRYQARGASYSFFLNYSIEWLWPKNSPTTQRKPLVRLTSATEEAISTSCGDITVSLSLEPAFSALLLYSGPSPQCFLQSCLLRGWHSQALISKHCGSPQCSGARGQQIWNWGWF
jgi:hypothetical protein